MAYNQSNSPFKKQKGGGTTKTCLPASKLRSMSKSEKDKLVRAKRSSGKAGKYRSLLKQMLKVLVKKGLH